MPVAQIVAMLFDVILRLVDKETARKELSLAEARAANAGADAIELARFGRTSRTSPKQ